MGGAPKAIEKGYIQQEIQDKCLQVSAGGRIRPQDSGRRNKFQIEEEPPKKPIEGRSRS